MRLLISAIEDSALNYALELARVASDRFEVEILSHEKKRILEYSGRKYQNRYAVDPSFGIADVLKNTLSYLRLLYFEDYRADVACLIDAPDFHIHLARMLKKKGIPVVFFILPKFWAWGGEKKIKKFYEVADALVSILPFEYEILKKMFSSRVYYFGHPLVKLVDFGKRIEVKDGVLFLPGSREGEVKRHVKKFAGFEFEASIVRREFADCVRKSFVAKTVYTLDDVERFNFFAGWMRALAKCGTVTLELALSAVPFVTFYVPDFIARFVGKMLVSVEYFSLPNLILRRKVVPEFIGDFDAKDVMKALEEIDTKTQLEAFEEIWTLLGERDVFAGLVELLEDVAKGSGK